MANNFDDLDNKLNNINDDINLLSEGMEGLTGKAKEFLKTFTNPGALDSIKKIKTSLQTQQNIAIKLSGITKENITDKNTQKQLQESISKLKREEFKLSSLARNNDDKLKDIKQNILKVEQQKIALQTSGTAKEKKAIQAKLDALVEEQIQLEENGKLLGESLQYTRDLTEEAEGLNELSQDRGLLLKKQLDLLKDKVTKALSLTVAFRFIKNLILDINKSTTSLQKDLNLSNHEASNFYGNMAQAAAVSNDVAISVNKLLKAQIALGEETGLYNARNTETLTTFSKLVDKIGISAKEASSLEMMSKLTGANFDQQRKSTAAIGVNLLRANGLNVKGSKILEQVANTTGQVAANLGNNPIEIAKAVAQAQLLGTTLEGVAKIANDLLNFESSISKELEAELLIGRDLNLERARALSLAGDQAGLAKELVNQVGTYSDFLSYNVIQQNQLAQAFGMSSDEMANMLKMQQYQNMNAEQLRAIGEEELAQNMEKQTLQENFNNLVEKMQTLFISIANGPLGTIANVISSILESTTAVVSITSVLAGLYTGKLLSGLMTFIKAKKVSNGLSMAGAVADIVKGAWTSLGPIPFVGAALAAAAVAGGVAYLYNQSSKAKQINDGVIDPQGGVVVSGPKGSIQLNKQDSIIAGTNLFDNPQPQPQTIVQPSITPQEMSNAIKEGMRGLQIVQEGVPMGQVMSKNIALHGDIPSSIA